ncbi:hypothetical protein E4U21_001323 [Claviceps maximensis]|nr:hypothetical protein E4U21_001323 [Claviceps maximensis]
MLRSTLPRAGKLAARPVEHGSEHVQPLKTFTRRVDDNKNVYYTLAKRGLGRRPSPKKEYAFFEISDLLLDLDAEGSPHVRSVADGDEAALMTAKWAKVPRCEAVAVRLKELEAQLAESRGKAHAILSQPTNVWRITPHDIVSAALHGGSAVQRTTAAGLCLLKQATDMNRTKARRVVRSDIIINKIRAENGIPPHAADDDQLLLHWMMLRYNSLQQHLLSLSSKTKGHGALSVSAMTTALQAQSSVTGIRRLVFGHLAAGANTPGTRHKFKFARLRREIRDACERVLGKSTTTTGASVPVEILTFLGNLSEQQLASVNAQLGPLLCGLAMKLAARVGSLEATSMWLYRCCQCNHMLGSLPGQDQLLYKQDVLSTLDELRSNLNGNDGFSNMLEPRQRQLLFQLLTGVDENNTLASDSIRSLIRRLCHDEHKSRAAELQRKLYTGYLTTLGHLGAVRTIWKEWRHLAPLRLAPATTSLSAEDGGVERAFAAALQIAIHAMPASGGKGSAGASLEECVTADYHAIELQELHSWRARMSDDDARQRMPGAAACCSALDLPLQECITRVASWR